MIAFINKKTLVAENIRLFNRVLACSENVKFLGVFFDSKLNWKMHLDYCLNKLKKFFWTCRSTRQEGALVLRSLIGFTR